MARSALRTRDTFVGDYDYGTNYNLPREDEDEDLTFIRSQTPDNNYNPNNNFDDDDDDYPIGDVIPPQTSKNNSDGIIHEGNYYQPIHNSNDYDVYEIQQVKQPFYDSTTNKDEYYWKNPHLPTPDEGDDNDEEEEAAPRQRMPFTSETTNKSTYLPHVPVKEEQKKTDPTEERYKAPFYGETSHRVNYTPKNVEKPSKVRPKTHLGTPSKNHPNETQQTMNQITYDAKQADEGGPIRYTAKDNLGVGGEFFGNTTNADEFIKHQVNGRPQRRKRSLTTLPKGALESLTTTREVYTPKKGGRPQRRKRSLTTLPKGALESMTTTREVYTPKKSEKECPAAKLLAAQKNHKINPKFRNGHFFLRIPKNYKNNVQQIIEENSFYKTSQQQNNLELKENIKVKNDPTRKLAAPNILEVHHPGTNIHRKQQQQKHQTFESPAPSELYDYQSTVYSPPPRIQSPRVLGLNDSQTFHEEHNNNNNNNQKYSSAEAQYAIPQKNNNKPGSRRQQQQKQRVITPLGFPIAK